MPNKDAALLPSPWNEFLKELDNILPEPLELHCIGGFISSLFLRITSNYW